jgi:predicted RNA-binding Zn ribbon-like protein
VATNLSPGKPGFSFVGNLLCLDLVNTEPMQHGERIDLLGDFGDLVRWLHAAGVLSAGQAQRAARRWGRSAEGTAAFRQAVALRSAVRAGAERLAAGKPVEEDLVKTVNRVLASRPAFTRLVRAGKGYATQLQAASDSALHLLVPVAESAAWLLEHGQRELVRRCEGSDCVLVFYDTTKNKSRRWCSMDGCGGRAKATAYYRRKHSGGNP